MTPYQMMLIANELMIKGVPVSANEQALLDGAVRHLADHPRHSGTVFYFRLLLSELPPVTALPVIAAMREPLLQQLRRSYVANSSDDVYVNTLPNISCVMVWSGSRNMHIFRTQRLTSAPKTAVFISIF